MSLFLFTKQVKTTNSIGLLRYIRLMGFMGLLGGFGAFFLVLACNPIAENSLEQSLLVFKVNEISQFKKAQFFLTHPSGKEEVLGEFGVRQNSIDFPLDLLKYEDGLRGEQVVPLNLKARFSREPDGINDFFFEVPIFDQTPVVNSINFALLLFLENTFEFTYETNSENENDSENKNENGVPHTPPRLSKEAWKKLLTTIELYCPSCIYQNTTQVIKTIQKNLNLQTDVLEIIKTENESIRKVKNHLQNWNFYSAHSNYLIANQETSPIEILEGNSLKLFVQFFHPSNSIQPIEPREWKLFKQKTLINKTSNPIFLRNFDYTESGTYLVQAFIPSISTENPFINFPVIVKNKNFLPDIRPLEQLNFKVNHKSNYDLSSFITDQDGTQGLSIILVSGPTGLAVSENRIIWNPESHQIGGHFLTLYVMDTLGGTSSIQKVSLSVLPDQPPAFSSLQTSYVVREGSESSINIAALDRDGDPLLVRVLDFVNDPNENLFLKHSPKGSGWNSSPVRITGSPGNHNFEFFIKPNYLQVLKVREKRFSVEVELIYDPAFKNLRAIPPIKGQTEIVIENTDDPPIWNMIPPTPNAPLQKGQIAASTIPLPPGSATDSTINPTALKYKITNLQKGCEYLQIDPDSGEISAEPPYSSPATCEFQIRAWDKSKLFSDSKPVTYRIRNNNRPPTKASPLPDVNLNLNEGQEWTLDLKEYFKDPDIEDNNPEETVYFTCTNCGPLGIEIDENGGLMTWTPDFSRSGTHNIRVEMEDQEMRDNSIPPEFIDLTLRVSNQSAPASITSGPSSSLFMNEGTTHTHTLNIQSSANTPIDQYPYQVRLICPSCRRGFLSLRPGDESGNTNREKDIHLNFSANLQDGNSRTSSFKIYSIRVRVEKTGEPNIFSEKRITMRVNNVNQPPTLLTYEHNGVVYNSAPTIEVDISNSPTTRFQEIVVNLGLEDPDGPQDEQNFEFYNTDSYPRFGEISGSRWTYTPETCFLGEKTIKRKIQIRGYDSMDQEVIGELNLQILNTRKTNTCP